MTSEQIFPEWVKPGATIAVVTRGNGWGIPEVLYLKVEKVTDSRITLENGRKFYKPKWGTSMVEVGHDVWSSPNIVSTNHPDLALWEAQRDLLKTRLRARKAVESWRAEEREISKARFAIIALQQFIEAAEKMEDE